MMVWSREKLEIGKRYDNKFVTDEKAEPHSIPFVVLGPSTLVEWLQEAHDEGHLVPPGTMKVVTTPGMNFYQISID